MTAPRASIFVDETKAKGFRLVAVTVGGTADLPAVRQELRSLLLPGQCCLHMKSERDQRRRAIVNTICALGISAVVYDAGSHGPTERDSRAWCIDAMAGEIVRLGTDANVVFDLDASMVSLDRQQMLVSTRGSSAAISYEHASRHEEPLLALPDALAWCWARGGPWRRRISEVVTDVRVPSGVRLRA